MSFVTTAIIGGVAALGSAGIGFAGAKKSADAAKSASGAAKDSAKAMERILGQLMGGSLFGMDAEDFTGKRPQFAELQKLRLGQGLQEGAKDQLEVLPDLAALTSGINAAQTLDDAVRFERLVPGGLAALRSQGQAAASLSRGELPFEDALKVVRDRSSLANTLGLGGTQFASAVPRDLGLSRLQALQSGAQLTAQTAQTANQINPISGQANLNNQFLTGPQSLDFQQRQNILNQQNDQNRFNLAASPSPLAQGLLGLELQRLQLRSSGQLAAAQIESSNALATSQMQQQSLAQLAQAFGGINSAFQQRQPQQQGFTTPTVQANPNGFNFSFL